MNYHQHHLTIGSNRSSTTATSTTVPSTFGSSPVAPRVSRWNEVEGAAGSGRWADAIRHKGIIRVHESTYKNII